MLRGLRIFARWSRLTLQSRSLSLQCFLTLLIAAHWLHIASDADPPVLSPDCEAEDIATDRCTFLYYYLDRMVNVSVRAFAAFPILRTGELMGTPYGDIIPVRGEERLYFIVCHLVAGFVNAYLVGGMVAAISALKARMQAFYNSMDTLNRFLKETPTARPERPEAVQRLRSYYASSTARAAATGGVTSCRTPAGRCRARWCNDAAQGVARAACTRHVCSGSG